MLLIEYKKSNTILIIYGLYKKNKIENVFFSKNLILLVVTTRSPIIFTCICMRIYVINVYKSIVVIVLEF